MKPTTCETAYLGGMESKMWTWSGIRWPSTTLHSLWRASSRNISPRCSRSLSNRTFLRYLGMKTTWYLQSHVEWLRLWLSFMGASLYQNFERFRWGRLPLYFRNCQTLRVPRQSRGFSCCYNPLSTITALFINSCRKFAFIFRYFD